MWSVFLLLRAFATLHIRLRLMVSRSRGCSARAAPRLRFPSDRPVQVTAGQHVPGSAPLLVSIQGRWLQFSASSVTRHRR